MDKLKNISLYFTCFSIIISALFGMFKTYDYLKAKFDISKINKKSIVTINEKIRDYDLKFKKMNLAIKKLRLKGNGKETMKKILEEEEKELEKRKRFLGIF